MLNWNTGETSGWAKPNIRMPKKNQADQQATQQLHFETSAAFSTREPMTAAQASHLKTLADEVSDPMAFQNGLTRNEARRRIDALKERLRIRALPPHTD
jgi:hypothetical protein